MKKFGLLLALITTLSFQASAQAADRTFECKGSSDFKTFSATLDDAVYDAGSGYFWIKSAGINDNYASAELTCVGYKLTDIHCVGFWFRNFNNIVEVTVAPNEQGQPVATRKALAGTNFSGSDPWTCTLK